MGKLFDLVNGLQSERALKVELDVNTATGGWIAGTTDSGRIVSMSIKNLSNAVERGAIKDGDVLELPQDKYFKDPDRSTKDYDVLFIRTAEGGEDTDLATALAQVKTK